MTDEALAQAITKLLCIGSPLLVTLVLYLVNRGDRQEAEAYPEIDRASAALASLAYMAAERAEGKPVSDDEAYVLDATIRMLTHLGDCNEAQQGWFLNYILREATGTETDEVPTPERARELLAGNLGLTYRVYGMLVRWLSA